MADSKITKLFGKNAETQKTIFHEIAEAGTLQLLHRIRDNVEEPIAPFLQEKDKNGDLCIHTVVRTHRGLKAVLLLKGLVELGADLNAISDIMAATVLHLGVMNSDYELVEWLAQQPQIDPSIETRNHLTAYQMAFVMIDYRMMNILKSCDASRRRPGMGHTSGCSVIREE